MTSFKGTNRKPTSSCDVRRRRNMGLPTGREPHGNGVPVVVRGWESQPHGEGEQRMDTQSLEGARDAQSRQATQRGTGKPAREPFLESWMTRKRSCPVRRGGIGKVAEQSGNSLVSYSTSRPVLRDKVSAKVPLQCTFMCRKKANQTHEANPPGKETDTGLRARIGLATGETSRVA